MPRIRPHIRSLRRAAGLLLILLGTALAFENCGRVSMVKSATSSSIASPIITMSELLVQTTLNHPVSTTLQNGASGAIFSFDQSGTQFTQTLANATVTLNGSQLTFAPNTGFRGSVDVTVYSTVQNVTNLQTITFQVDNPLLSFQPALAVRGPQCLFCHANIQGDMVSDFGYKNSSDAGPDLFFTAQNNSKFISIFGVNYGTGLGSPTQSFQTMSIVGHLILPAVNLATLDPTVYRLWDPVNPASVTPAITNLKTYIDTETPLTSTGYEGSVQKSSVYIGAPTTSDIQTAAGALPAGGTQFYPNTVTDPTVSGLTHVTTSPFNYYTNSGTLVCEGDLFVDGVVWLNHLTVQTTYGCRIYATRSVFINGPITYSNVSALSNMQVTSAIGIYMGFGYCIDCDGYSTYGFQGQSTVQGRLNDIYNNYNAIVSYRTMSVATNRDAAFADAALVSATAPTLPSPVPTGAALTAYYQTLQSDNVRLFDASNSFVNEASTTYSRLLLNAPVVMSRYTGNFEGVVIAEFALWRLGAFTFTFDPVFTGVSLLPFLDFTKILNVVN